MIKRKLLNKSLLLVSKILLSLLLSSCATVKAPDVPVCTEINYSKGFCTYTISEKDEVIDDNNLLEGKTWWDLRPQMIQVPISSWVKIKEFIIKICKKTNQCEESITSWDRKIETIDSKLLEKGPLP